MKGIFIILLLCLVRIAPLRPPGEIRLADQLTTLIWGAKDVYSIPHYLLFDKNARLVSKDASPRVAQDFRQK